MTRAKKKEQKRPAKKVGSSPAKQMMQLIKRNVAKPKPVLSEDKARAPGHAGEARFGKIASVRATVGKEAENNAAAYAAALAMPFDAMAADTRVPDLLTWPSSTAVLYEEHSIRIEPSGPSPGPKGNVQLVITPTLTTSTSSVANNISPFWNWRATHDTSTFAAWHAPAVPSVHAAQAQVNMFSFRTVAFGVQMIPQTPLQDRSGSVHCSLWWDPHTLSTSPLEVPSLPTCRTVAGSSADVDGLQQVWRPGDYVEALDYRFPSSSIAKGCLIFQFQGHTLPQDYRFRIVHHVEYLPRPAVSPFVEVKAASGNEAATSSAVEAVMRVIGNFAAATTYTAGEVARIAPQIGNAITQVTRAANSVAGIAGAFMAMAPDGPALESAYRALGAIHKRHGRGGSPDEVDQQVERMIREERAMAAARVKFIADEEAAEATDSDPGFTVVRRREPSPALSRGARRL